VIRPTATTTVPICTRLNPDPSGSTTTSRPTPISTLRKWGRLRSPLPPMQAETCSIGGDEMRVLVGCESSGVVRSQFRSRGHDAWSNDLFPAVDEDPHHLQMDVFEAIENHGPWDLGIFHPDCTYLTSAAEWCYSDEAKIKATKRGSNALFGKERRKARDEAVKVFLRLWECPIENVCIENPVGVIPSRTGIKATQIVNPYQYGHDASKRTCLWLRGKLRPLAPTKLIEPKHGCGSCRVKFVFDDEDNLCPVCGSRMKPVYGNQTPSGQNKLGPSEDRWRVRSVTYEGIARAMAETWGSICI
jgi:hypothetical protein